ncbi:MAG: hypothetical protein PUJ82_14870, partial [Spirochaetales bacterium]|nr:hypothetical protein [Spirochaetales bacterium]MDY5914374.1 hypothetical protein [Treponema sp.]
YDDNRFKEYFQNIQSGYMSASDAIRQFKTEYSYLLEDSFKYNNDTFGLEQLQAFSNKLDSIFRQVEETSTKINDIISNGVITKSVENLSMDSSLSDSQRSLFGNLLQDEESLKSITALFQKLIEESNKTSKVDLFNDEQLQQVLSIFDKMEYHLSSLRSIVSDVGDGEEFSPLLKALNDIKEAASNIKLNFNMDLGDEVSERLNQKVSQASARQLEAYRKLFSAMKGTGKTNKEMLKFFEPDEASVTELIGTYKGIIERAEKQFKVGNSNIYKKYLGAEYDALKREITNANKQLSRADSKRSENGILGDLFGNTKDLSGVIEQLNKIIKKLDEISKSALEFKSTFKEGFNVTASVEEITKLTNRVKELEDELSKVKLNPVDGNKSNISSVTQIKDVFQGDDKVNTNASTTAIKEESRALEQVSTSAKDAASSKEKFAKANKEVKASADSSTPAINKESDALKSEWDKNVKAIQDYMDAVTKLNNLNAKDKGTGKYSSQIALQEKNVEELKEKALEARTAITSMINPHDVPLNTWRDYLDVMKKFDQASLGSAESVAKLEDALRKMDFSSLESAGTKFDSQFKNLSIKPDGDHQFLSWTNDLKELNAKIDEYNSKVKYLKDNKIVDGEQVDEVKKLRDEIEETINVMTKTPQAKRGWTDIGASKAAEKVANVLKQNTKMSKEARDAIRAYYNELRSGNPSQPIDEILVKVNQLVQKERELGRVGK